MINKVTEVFTTDGELFKGKLVGVDHALNLVMEDCRKGTAEKFEEEAMAAFVIRGDLVCSISINNLQ